MNLELVVDEPLNPVAKAARAESNFGRRVIWTSDGWYLTLRNEDANLGNGLARHHVDIRTIGSEVVAGPFRTRDLLVGWFKRFVDTHGKPRNPGEAHNHYVHFTFAA